jgi:hypothetical protein
MRARKILSHLDKIRDMKMSRGGWVKKIVYSANMGRPIAVPKASQRPHFG